MELTKKIHALLLQLEADGAESIKSYKDALSDGEYLRSIHVDSEQLVEDTHAFLSELEADGFNFLTISETIAAIKGFRTSNEYDYFMNN